MNDKPFLWNVTKSSLGVVLLIWKYTELLLTLTWRKGRGQMASSVWQWLPIMRGKCLISGLSIASMPLVQHLTDHALWSTTLSSRLSTPEQLCHLCISCTNKNHIKLPALQCRFNHLLHLLCLLYPGAIRQVTLNAPYNTMFHNIKRAAVKAYVCMHCMHVSKVPHSFIKCRYYALSSEIRTWIWIRGKETHCPSFESN